MYLSKYKEEQKKKSYPLNCNNLEVCTKFKNFNAFIMHYSPRQSKEMPGNIYIHITNNNILIIFVDVAYKYRGIW